MKNILKTLTHVNKALKEKGLTGTLAYSGETSHMVRCGRSQISLNVSKNAEFYGLTLQEGKRQISGSISPSQNIEEKLITLAEELSEKISMMPEIDHLTPLKAITQADLNINNPDQKLADEFDSSVMVELYSKAHERFKDKDVEISGAFSAGTYAYAIINTLVDKPVSYRGSDYNTEIVLQLLKLNKQELRAASVGETLASYNQQELLDSLERDYYLKTKTERSNITAGDYDVIFSADALGEMALYMSWITLTGEHYEYQAGMLQKDKHEIGSKIFGENITITDHLNDQESLFSRPIGKNGIERKDFPLIENGVLKNFYYSDKETCDRFDKVPNNDFSVASLKMHPGKGPEKFDEMVKSCQKPTLYIGYIHYLNFTNMAKGEFTGTSRFGTWLIEKGEVKKHLYNLRLNDSFHKIFNKVEWLSSNLKAVNTSTTYGMRTASAITCPAFVKVNDVHISGSNAPT